MEVRRPRTAISLAVIAVVVSVRGMITYGGWGVGDTEAQIDYIDMVTDADGNGIPDGFEIVFNGALLIAGVPGVGTDGPTGADDAETRALAAIEALEVRIPVKPQTRRIQGHILSYMQILADPNTRERRHPIITAKILDLQNRMLTNDPVYAAAMRHTGTLLDRWEGDTFAPEPTVSGTAGRTVRGYEGQLNRRGDIILFDHATNPFNWINGKDWDHVALYDGSGKVYDSDLRGSVSGDCNGVDLRSLRGTLERSQEVQYAQLDDRVDRLSTWMAVSGAKREYGEDCTTSYNLIFWNKNRDDALYCSQLVWKAYLNELPSSARVDLNSNNFAYLAWLTFRYGSVGRWFGAGVSAAFGTYAYIIGRLAVAPDEIARDSDLDYYFRENVVLTN